MDLAKFKLSDTDKAIVCAFHTFGLGSHVVDKALKGRIQSRYHEEFNTSLANLKNLRLIYNYGSHSYKLTRQGCALAIGLRVRSECARVRTGKDPSASVK